MTGGQPRERRGGGAPGHPLPAHQARRFAETPQWCTAAVLASLLLVRLAPQISAPRGVLGRFCPVATKGSHRFPTLAEILCKSNVLFTSESILSATATSLEYCR